MGLNIILTNDDGYNAPGIQTLYAALVAAGNTVHIVAPLTNQSAQGSSLGGTAALTAPIAINQFSSGNYSVDGRPVVATKTALQDLFAGQPVDVVVSGTNAGDNIGQSENISGTVNGAIAGLFAGVPSIAISAGSAGGTVGYTNSFANAGAIMVDLLNKLQANRAAGAPLLPPGQGLTINVPSARVLNGTAITQIDAESSAYYPIGLKANGLYNSTFTPATASLGNPLSEGSQFLAGNATITPIDGNWSASESVRAALQARLGASLGTAQPAGQPLNIMLVNDDGYQAAGLAALRTALLAAGYNVTVVAPATDQSGIGSALTLSDFSVTQYSQGYYVGATPATTVETGLDALLTGANRPALVLSGINAGANVGLQAISSGTIGAAITAIANYGISAIALSAGTDGSGAVPAGLYDTGAAFAVNLIRALQATAAPDGSLLPKGTGLDVNIPVGASASNVAFTTIDQASNLSINVVAGSNGNAQFSLGAGATSTNPVSEGTAFNAGKITVSTLDGNFTSNDQTFSNQLASIEGTTLGKTAPGYAAYSGSRTGYSVGLSGNTVQVTGPSIDDSVNAATKLTFAEGTLSAGAASATGLTIGGLYQELFGRSADAGGFSFWLGAAQKGATTDAIAQGFTASTEFSTALGALSNTDYVGSLYQNGLQRTADAGGQTFWTSQLTAGASRAAVALGIASSAEFQQVETRPVFTMLAKLG